MEVDKPKFGKRKYNCEEDRGTVGPGVYLQGPNDIIHEHQEQIRAKEGVLGDTRRLEEIIKYST